MPGIEIKGRSKRANYRHGGRIEKNMGGMVDKRYPFKGGGIAYAGGGKAMKRGKV